MCSSPSYFVLPRIGVVFCNIVLEVSLEIYGVYWQSKICGRSALRDESIERLDYFLLSNSSLQ